MGFLGAGSLAEFVETVCGYASISARERMRVGEVKGDILVGGGADAVFVCIGVCVCVCVFG